MARTTDGAVKILLGGDYDAGTPARPARQLAPFLDAASAVVTRLAARAAAASVAFSAADQEVVERWLAAYYYTLSDRLYTSRTTQGASGQFLMGKENPYKQGALDSDPTGLLGRLLSRRTATAAWAGKTESEQTSYEERMT